MKYQLLILVSFKTCMTFFHFLPIWQCISNTVSQILLNIASLQTPRINVLQIRNSFSTQVQGSVAIIRRHYCWPDHCCLFNPQTQDSLQ